MFIPLKYNLRYLRTRWTGVAMTALTFALVVATFVIVMSLSRGIEQALTATGNPLNVLIMRPGAQAEGQSSVRKDLYLIVRNLRGITRDAHDRPMAVPELIVLVNKSKRPDGQPANLQVRGIYPTAMEMRPEVRIVSGRMFRPGLREAIVSRSASLRFQGMDLGDKVRLGRGTWTIVGLFEAKGTAFDSELWCDCEELMTEFDRRAYCTIFARAENAAGVESIRRQVDSDNRLKLTAKTEEQYYREQTKVAGPLKAFGYFLAIVMAIGACFAGMNTMYASVANRVREIATLRVLGFTPFAILISFQIESIALALFGGAIGCILAMPINGLATGTMNIETFSEIVFYFSITPDLMARGLSFAALMGAAGGFLPAFSAARQPILASIRQA